MWWCRPQDRTGRGTGKPNRGGQCPSRGTGELSGLQQKQAGGETVGRKDANKVFPAFVDLGRGSCPCPTKLCTVVLGLGLLGTGLKTVPLREVSLPRIPRTGPSLELSLPTAYPELHLCNPTVFLFPAALSVFHIFGSDANKGKLLLRSQPVHRREKPLSAPRKCKGQVQEAPLGAAPSPTHIVPEEGLSRQEQHRDHGQWVDQGPLLVRG